MNTVLHAHIPIPNPASSPWKTGPSCSWRLCANRSRPNVVSLSLHLVRHQTDSSGFITVNVEYPEIASKPVQNLHVARQLPRHPHEIRLHLPSGEPLTVLNLPLTYAPADGKGITLKIDILIEEQPTSPTAVRHTPFSTLVTSDPQLKTTSPNKSGQSSPHPTQLREIHTHSPSPKPTSISWIDERSHSSSTYRSSKDSLCSGGTSLSKRARGGALHSHRIDQEEVQTGPKYELKSLLSGCGCQATAKQSRALSKSSDVTLVVEGDEGDDVEFHIHRSVLTMASPVFRAMFSCGMRENQTGRVELSNFDVSTVSLAVRHMYGEDITEFVVQSAFDVYGFGHQFDMTSLCDVAQKVILTKMCGSTCIDVLNLGVFFNDTALAKHATAFILDHFSELVSVKETCHKLCLLPPTSFLALIESDMLVATELEVFLVSMEWLSCHEGSVSIKDVLRRIRWPLMTQHMFRTAMSSPLIIRFPALRNFLRSSQATISQHLNGIKPRRREVFGEPMVTILVPTIREPPAALLYLSEASSSENRKPGSKFSGRHVHELRLSSRNEKVFEHEDLKWVFRAELSKCKSLGCSHPRLSVSLWLDQDDEGSVSSTMRQDVYGSRFFPMKVKARCMVWNGIGGQLHHRVIDVTFQSSGWAGGWCVEDMLGGHKQTKTFLDKLNSLRGVVPVLQVAVEILKCEKG
ncbi:kelch-like ECH-associated protein [Gracilaria domingensis]|nr:kelch-like ECH-associated protein [Gracilaria domingensis]